MDMNEVTRDMTSAIVDGIIRFIAAGGFITTALVAPNAVQVLDKPLSKLTKGLDKRQREREIRRVLSYMKSRGIIRYDPTDYEHGISLTKAGKKRLAKTSFASITIPRPTSWDKQWRLVFYDIPENHRIKRNALGFKLKELGFKQLQFSIWVHPFPCRPEIEAACEFIGIRNYVSYIEVSQIDSARLLRKRFRHLIVK